MHEFLLALAPPGTNGVHTQGAHKNGPAPGLGQCGQLESVRQ